MYSFVFIITINIIFFNQIIITQTSHTCTNYVDCFNCSVCEEDSTNKCECHWDTNSKACGSGTEKTFNDKHYGYFTSCTDDKSNSIIKQYCGETTLKLNDKGEVEINIPKVYDRYGTSRLYCEYTFIPEDNKDVFFTIKYEVTNENYNQMELFLSLLFIDETETSGYLSKNSFERDFDSIKQIKLGIYFKNGLTSKPLSFLIKKKKDNTKLILYLTIGAIILACIVCAIIIYFLSKKISQNARLRQRTLMELAMERQRGEYDDRGSEAEIEEENRKKIEILLKTCLASKKFHKKYGAKDGNTCTICIEDFKEGRSNVSVTSCQHVFHYKCLSNWMIKNILNPKCPNCNYNLLQDVNLQKLEELQTININKKNSETINSESQGINENNNMNSNSNNVIISRQTNNRQGQRRITNNQHHNQNTESVGNNDNREQEIIIQNI